MKGYIQPVIYHPLARSGTLEVRIAGGTTKTNLFDPLTGQLISNPVPMDVNGVSNPFYAADTNIYDLVFKDYLGNVVDSRENVMIIGATEQEGPTFVQSVAGNVVDNLDPANPVITAVASVTGNIVDNTDPQNPVVNFTETDPTVPSYVKAITELQISNWDGAAGSISGLVPYTGATGNVNLGIYSLTTTGNLSGAIVAASTRVEAPYFLASLSGGQSLMNVTSGQASGGYYKYSGGFGSFVESVAYLNSAYSAVAGDYAGGSRNVSRTVIEARSYDSISGPEYAPGGLQINFPTDRSGTETYATREWAAGQYAPLSGSANYVPYTGATTTLNLGAQALTTTGNISGAIVTASTRVTTPEVRAASSAGLTLANSSGTAVALLGAGPGTGVTLYGAININSTLSAFAAVINERTGVTANSYLSRETSDIAGRYRHVVRIDGTHEWGVGGASRTTFLWNSGTGALSLGTAADNALGALSLATLTASGVVTCANATADGHAVNRVTGDARYGRLVIPNATALSPFDSTNPRYVKLMEVDVPASGFARFDVEICVDNASGFKQNGRLTVSGDANIAHYQSSGSNVADQDGIWMPSVVFSANKYTIYYRIPASQEVTIRYSNIANIAGTVSAVNYTAGAWTAGTIGSFANLVSHRSAATLSTGPASVNARGLSITEGDYIYLKGNSDTDGSIRFYASGDDVFFQRRISGTWATPYTINL
jgi:hypothetical protein